MNILMLSLDNSVLPGSAKSGNTASRLTAYLIALQKAEPNSTMTVMVFTPRPAPPFSSGGISFIPVKTRSVALFPLTGLLAAYRYRKTLNADLITTQNPFECGLLGVLIRKLIEAPLEMQIHLNLFSAEWLAERFANRVRFWLAHRLVKRADAIRVVSSGVKERLVNSWQISPEKIVIIPIPVFFEEFSQKGIEDGILSDSQSQIILFVGRLHPTKNLPGLFEICATVLKEVKSAEFVIVGDGPLRNYAEQQAENIDPERVHILGSLPYEALQGWYQRASVIVLTSAHEGFARVLVEGYLFGTPAVATRSGGPQDIIEEGETGFLTDIHDFETFAQKIVWLLDHPAEAKAMGARGQQLMRERFDRDHLIEQIITQWQFLSDANP